MVRENKTKNGKAHLLGVGLDNKDGHVRITRGDNFHLMGGSQETHEQMQEQTIKLNEKLSNRGKCLDNVSPEEFRDIAQELGMQVFPHDTKPS